jgi:tRNA 5-methylaminomethyl-2-thiouridine biosynthesis bifunctional protein
MVTIPTADLRHTSDGTPWSETFGDVYHSAGGALGQARHVFLGGNALPERWRGRDRFTILETGFGLGVNFLAARDAWRADPSRPRRLHFVSFESQPFRREDLARALGPIAELASLARDLVAAWPPPLAGFHRMFFDDGAVTLTLVLGDAQQALPQLVGRADALFLDGFAPARNPGIWSPEVVRELARIAAPGATLATWTVAGGVRAALAGAGFRVEKRAGFGAKREMLCGARDGVVDEAPAPTRHAVVVGAGLAGSLVTERLAARGWEIDLVDARAERSAAAVGLLRPVVNLRDALNAQVSRSAFLHALHRLDSLGARARVAWRRSGVLQLAGSPEEDARFAAIVRSQGHPRDFLAHADAGFAARIAGRAVRGGGWWFPSGAVVPPAAFADACLAAAKAAVRRSPPATVDRLEREGSSWRALDAAGRVIAQAPTLVLANAFDARRLLPEARLPLSAVRGQVTYLPPTDARSLDIVVSGSGYVAPLPGGGHCIGASYRHDDPDASVRPEEHEENLRRAEAMLPGFTAGLDGAALRGWTGYRATVPDRLPIFGASDVPGIHLATGLGSRGLLWAPLGAELLASALEGDPLPLSRDHAGAISPRRFLS